MFIPDVFMSAVWIGCINFHRHSICKWCFRQVWPNIIWLNISKKNFPSQQQQSNRTFFDYLFVRLGRFKRNQLRKYQLSPGAFKIKKFPGLKTSLKGSYYIFAGINQIIIFIFDIRFWFNLIHEQESKEKS